MLTRVLGLAALGLAVAAGGCSDPTKARVQGKVTLDGQPLKNGTIEFFPLGKTGQSAAGPIINGEYEVTKASVGEMRVKINGSEVVGQQKLYDTPDSPTVDQVNNPVPAKYNTNSQLKETLVSGDNELNFELKSGKK
jgi:hypothetical protein